MKYKSSPLGFLIIVFQLYTILLKFKKNISLWIALLNLKPLIMNAILKSKVQTKCKSALLLMLLCPMLSFPQSDLIKGGELLFGGLITVFNLSKPKNVNSTVVESICVKNKLANRITFIISRQTEDGDEIRKELVIQKDSKEYFFELPKGVYTYEVILPNKEIYKKGEYKFDDDVVITIKDD